MYVNLFGNTLDWDRFQMQTKFFNDDMIVIEDAAQSFGASYNGVPSGKMGTVSVLSFDPTKNLANYGSGGMILTDDLKIYEVCRGLRDNGKTGLLYHEHPGTNSKMSESDCAQLLIKLNYFDSWQRRRTEIAAYYTEQLYQYVDFPEPTEGTTHAWSKYVIQSSSRTSLQAHLSYNKIETRIHYEDALYDIGVGFPYANYGKVPYTETSRFTRECLSLPIYPELSDAEVETIAQTVRNYFS
jgi:dTDP-4-amino-4,6-dideoxygalactose transaminase